MLSLNFNTMLMWIRRRWGHLLKDPFAQGFFSAERERVATYSTKITENVGPDLHVWGFIDGTVRPICRPVRDQQQFYNGHERVHALKYQVVVTLEGMIAHLFGPVEGRRHDAGVLAETGLLQQLAAHMDDPHGVPYALHVGVKRVSILTNRSLIHNIRSDIRLFRVFYQNSKALDL